MKRGEKLTAPARSVLKEAHAAAQALGHAYVGSEHLLIGLLRVKESPAGRLLAEFGLTEETVARRIRLKVGAGLSGLPPVLGLSVHARSIIRCGAREAGRRGRAALDSEHILLGLLLERGCTALRLMERSGADPEGLLSRLKRGAPAAPSDGSGDT